jgi:Protein of unknown function (DUF1236)
MSTSPLSVGTAVPRDVRFQPLPAEVVEILPQYRGYNFFVVRDDIVIVEPSTYKIVDVLPRTGRSTVAAPGTVVAQSDFFRQGSRDHPQTRAFFTDRTAHHRQQHYEYPGPDRGALAGVRGDPILPRDGLSGITEAA